MRFPEIWRLAAVAGVDAFTISSSWPLKRIEHWNQLLIARAIENQAFVIGANRIGDDAIARWGGSSAAISATGEVLALCGREDCETISVPVDFENQSTWREEFPVLNDIKEEFLGKINVRTITA